MTVFGRYYPNSDLYHSIKPEDLQAKSLKILNKMTGVHLFSALPFPVKCVRNQSGYFITRILMKGTGVTCFVPESGKDLRIQRRMFLLPLPQKVHLNLPLRFLHCLNGKWYCINRLKNEDLARLVGFLYEKPSDRACFL